MRRKRLTGRITAPLGRYFADGADVVEQLIELPLPGRTFVAQSVAAPGRPAEVTLPSFVAGAENRVVATTVSHLLDDVHPTQQSTPAVVALFGPSGTGKTHLMRGVVNYWEQCYGNDSAGYVTANDFRRQFVAAMNDDNVSDFRRQFRSRKLLALDDLHCLPSDAYLLDELRHTVDELEDAGGTILVAANRPIGTLSNLSPDLRSRLSSGLVLRLASPDASARQHIVKQASQALGQPLSNQATLRLADSLHGTANELFGAVLALLAGPSNQSSSDLERTERFLAARAARRPSLREIIGVVAKHHRIPQKLLKSESRKHAAVLARATVVYLARELAGTSYEEIGRILGGRDHTTIMHSYQKIDQDRQYDSALQESLDELQRTLETR